jgi:ABC-type spermidine/putrescine transport system permease subunit II
MTAGTSQPRLSQGLPSPRPSPASGRGRILHKGPAPYLFLSPYLILISIFFIVPFVNAIVLAFYETNGPRSRAFVGFDNFRFLLHDTTFHTALLNTTIFALVSVCVQLPLAMGLALLLNGGNSRVRGIFRLIFYSPNLVGQVLVGILFAALFTPRYGLITRGFQAFFHWGLEAHWLHDPPLIMPAIVIASLWVWVGFNMVYFLAALQTVDKSLEEAARIDGATAWQVFWHDAAVHAPRRRLRRDHDRDRVVPAVRAAVDAAVRELRLRREERGHHPDHVPQLLRVPVGRSRAGVGRGVGDRLHHLHHQPDPDPHRAVEGGLKRWASFTTSPSGW